MKISYNPASAPALTTAPANNDITFDLRGLNIFSRGVKFKGTDTTYSVFKKHTSSGSGGYNGLVPVPSYTTTNSRYLREDGTWQVPSSQYTYSALSSTDLDTLKTEGRWYYIGGGSSNTNGPEGINNGAELYVGRHASGYRYLKVILATNDTIWYRANKNNAWTAWIRLYTDANTDSKVLLAVSTTANFRPLILGSNNSTTPSSLTGSVTNQVYVNAGLYVQPSTGSIFANIFKGQLNGSIASNTTAVTLTSTDNSTKVATTQFVRIAIANLVNGAPETLDTLKEIADYLLDGNIAGGLVDLLSKKVNKTGDTMTGDLTFAPLSGSEYPITSKGLKWSGSSDSAAIFFRLKAANSGDLIFRIGDDAPDGFIWENMLSGASDPTLLMKLTTTSLIVKGNVTAPTFIGKLQGNADTATSLGSLNAGSMSLPVYFASGKPVACTASSVFSALANDSNLLSITVAGLNRKLTLAYATSSGRVNGVNITTYEDIVPSSYITGGGIKGFNNGNGTLASNGFATANTSGAIMFGKSNSAVILASLAGLSNGSIFIKLYYRSWGGWFKLLHSGNTHISNGTITINGTSIKPLVSIPTLTFAEGKFVVGTYNGTAAKTINVPTKTSHLTNDSGFLTGGTEITTNITTITKSLTVTLDWIDTGISGTNLPANGTYIILVYVQAADSTGEMWTCYNSGVMSWYKDGTNDSETDEILLHRSGHAYRKTIYLRTIMQSSTNGGVLKLLISASANIGAAYTYTFKFKRII